MSQEHTIVVRFADGVVPRYSAATEFQGGQVVAVDFDGNRLRIAQELEESLEDCITAFEIYAPLDDCITALEPCDVIKPRDWKTDRESLRRVYQSAHAALAKARGES